MKNTQSDERAVTPPTSPVLETETVPKITDLADDTLFTILDLVLDATDDWDQDHLLNKFYQKKPALATELSLVCRTCVACFTLGLRSTTPAPATTRGLWQRGGDSSSIVCTAQVPPRPQNRR